MISASDFTRFISKVDIKYGDGCWEWLAGKNTYGYGVFGIGRKTYLSHRVSFEYFCGLKIPKGLVTDHECRNPSCVRPDHLRIVTRGINVIENSNSKSALNSIKTHCKRGHEFTEDNIYHIPTGGRHCRTCRKEADYSYKATHRDHLRKYNQEYHRNNRGN
jgi:hypothetical protein